MSWVYYYTLYIFNSNKLVAKYAYLLPPYSVVSTYSLKCSCVLVLLHNIMYRYFASNHSLNYNSYYNYNYYSHNIP